MLFKQHSYKPLLNAGYVVDTYDVKIKFLVDAKITSIF